MKKQDQRSKRFVFIPFCMICQTFQAQGIVIQGFSSVMYPVTDLLFEHDVNIIQMPCPESMLHGLQKGLACLPQGYIKYKQDKDFIEICEQCSDDVYTKILGILENDYKVIAILGIEFSPSCAVKLMFSNKGVKHQPGVFMEMLQIKLAAKNIDIPFIGINRRGMKSSLARLEQIFG